MELRQLRYLVALDQERNFTRAAAREHVAQPALSQQIRRLEDEVGVPLVERTTRSVSITEAGQLLVDRAGRILAELDAARSELESLRGVETGHVSIGTMHTMGPIDISRLLEAFHARHPAVGLSVREQASEELAEMLRADELDLAFLSVTERIESHGLALRQLVAEELVVVLAPEHPLAGTGRLRIGQLAEESFVSYRPGARLRELLFGAASSAGFTPRIMLESNESQRIRGLVSHGLAVALLPCSDAEAPGPPVAIAELVAHVPARDITLAWRAGRRLAPAPAAFLALARATLPSQGDGCEVDDG